VWGGRRHGHDRLLAWVPLLLNTYGSVFGFLVLVLFFVGAHQYSPLFFGLSGGAAGALAVMLAIPRLDVAPGPITVSAFGAGGAASLLLFLPHWSQYSWDVWLSPALICSIFVLFAVVGWSLHVASGEGTRQDAWQALPVAWSLDAWTARSHDFHIRVRPIGMATRRARTQALIEPVGFSGGAWATCCDLRLDRRSASAIKIKSRHCGTLLCRTRFCWFVVGGRRIAPVIPWIDRLTLAGWNHNIGRRDSQARLCTFLPCLSFHSWRSRR
jgi:hypothetical protein